MGFDNLPLHLAASPLRNCKPAAFVQRCKSKLAIITTQVGGQVDLHGLPFPAGTAPTWTKLAVNALQGASQLVLQDDVSGAWPVGGEIVVASTDYDASQAEVFTITAVAPLPSGGSALSLAGQLAYSHQGTLLPAPLFDGAAVALDQCAEVALLTRNVAVRGLDEPSPFDLEGAHFMIYHTAGPQTVEGVELRGLGQQGTLGRYPLHVHLSGPGSTLRANVVRDSRQARPAR
eukprot:SM003864S14612  [mRNA]  locus=s3864:50:954:+ [translate_table: standard]